MPNRIDAALIPLSPNLQFESSLWSSGNSLVAGFDEAGRGAWAGPVVAAAALFPAFISIPRELRNVKDSKQLNPVQRSELAPIIKLHALDWGIGFASNFEIDELGILPATILAMTRALEQLRNPPEHLLIDALFLPEIPVPQTSLIKGDQRSFSIAAASVLAKTTRDEYMTKVTLSDHDYGFEKHKGYGTKLHQERIAQYGPCQLHRFSFKPLRNFQDNC